MSEEIFKIGEHEIASQVVRDNKDKIVIRKGSLKDLDIIDALQKMGYKESLWEDKELFERIINAQDAIILIAEFNDSAKGRIPIGYLVGYSVDTQNLETFGEPTSGDNDAIYLHDACSPLKGSGAGNLLNAEYETLAKSAGWTESHLIAVQGAEKYWPRHDYETYATKNYTPQDTGYVMKKTL